MKKGFTLIELLAVIVILAIILVIAVPMILNIVESQKEAAYNTQLKLFSNAVKNGLNSSLLSFPNNNHPSVEDTILLTNHDYTLKELIDAGLISNIRDPRNGNLCDVNRSYVNVVIENNIYKYTPNLTCENENDEGVVLRINKNSVLSNTSAAITSINDNEIGISGTSISDINGDFAVGDEVLLIATTGTTTSTTGWYDKFIIMGINSGVLTLDRTVDTNKFSSDTSQVVKMIKADTIYIEENVKISPRNYNGRIGGVIAIKASKSLIISGKIDASFTGYNRNYQAPNNGQIQASGNNSLSGGSNQFPGGAGGTNYQGVFASATPGIGTIDMREKLYMGGGSAVSRGGGIVYIDCNTLDIKSEYPISSNGQGGAGIHDAGGAGGSILIKTQSILETEYNDYFAGATGGGGGGEYYVNPNFPSVSGSNGTNAKGGNGATQTGTGGLGLGANGGGGSKHSANGFNATTISGGAGANNSATSGYNAGTGGGGGGYIGIITSTTDIDKYLSITYPEISFYYNTSNYEVVSGNITSSNTSAKVTNINNNVITIGSTISGSLTGNFNVNDEVLLIATKGTTTSTTGWYKVYTIVGINGNDLTLNTAVSSNFNNTNSQVVKIAKYNKVIFEGTIKPSNYNGDIGGVIAIKATSEIIFNKTVSASYTGYNRTHQAPNNGQIQSSGNNSTSGGSNRYPGGAGGKNYQGVFASVTPGIGTIDMREKLYMGGGSATSRGGGIIYIDTPTLRLNTQYGLSVNGQGGAGVHDGGGAGGSILIKTEKILGIGFNNYFAGATGGGGGGEYYDGSAFYWLNGENGTNLIGGKGATKTGIGGLGLGANGGGGSKHNANGFNATTTSGGAGANNSGTAGYNAGSGGGGGGYIGIISSNSNVMNNYTVYPSQNLYSN